MKIAEKQQSKKADLVAMQKQLERFGIQKELIPQKIGIHGKGEWEILAIKSIEIVMEGKLYYVTYRVKSPHTGEEIDHIVRYSCGVVAIVIINKTDVLVTNQHRLCIGSWLREFPQCFTYESGPLPTMKPGKDQSEEEFDQEMLERIDRNITELTSRKLQWLIDIADEYTVEHIGGFYADPGTRADFIQCCVIEVAVDDQVYEETVQRLGYKSRNSSFQFHRDSILQTQLRITNGYYRSMIMSAAWGLAVATGKIPTGKEIEMQEKINELEAAIAAINNQRS